jgi:periplasmic protein TonB
MEQTTDSAAQEGPWLLDRSSVLSSFAPRDERTLWRGLSASGLLHGVIATSLLIYGVELTGLEQRAAESTIKAAQPIQATFVFEERQEPDLKPHLVPERVAEAVKPEPKQATPPKRIAHKAVPKKPRTKKRQRLRTAQRPSKAANAKRVEPAVTVIAPPAADTAATTVIQQPAHQAAVASGPSTPSRRAAALEGKVDLDGLMKGYVKTLSRAVRKRRAYPRAAKLAGLEGRAVVRIVLNSRGGIVTIELASSSGHDILDRAALEAARSVGSLPAAPSGLNWGTRAIKVPFSFKVAS